MRTRSQLLSALALGLLTMSSTMVSGAGTSDGQGAPSAPSAYHGLGAASITPELVARYAAKPLDAATSRRIQSLFDLRAPESGIASPDGKHVFFSWSVTGVNQVWRLDGPQRFPVQMTGGEDATRVEDITPDGQWLVLSRDRRGEENPGLYLQRTSGGELRAVQHVPGVQTVAQFVSDDGRYLYFKSNDQSPGSFAIYRYDLTSGTRETVFAQDGLWNVDDHRPDGRLLLRKDTGNTSAEYWSYDPATKALQPLFGQNEHEDYTAAFAADPDEILVDTPKLGEFRRLYRWQAGKLAPVTPDIQWDVESFAIDAARKHIFYSVNEGGFSRLHILDAKTMAELVVQALPKADSVLAGSTTRDGRITMLRLETAKSPEVSYAIDWVAGTLTQWVAPSSPEVDTSAFSDAVLESYPARDGTPIPMLVRRRQSPATVPAR